jgi:hypothetical protein
VVIGIAGELVKGFTTSHNQERRRPDRPISNQELTSLIDAVQHDALREAERTITWETGLPNVDIRLVHAAVTGASIDGYAVTNPVGFQGRHVRISIFNAFAPLVHLGALQSVASQLDLELLAIVAEPYAVARCLQDDQIDQSGALFIDVGGGTTDVALVRGGGIEGTRMFALGGRAFTKSLADRLELPFARAEEIKVDFAKRPGRRAAGRGRADRRRGRRRMGSRRRAGARGVRQGGHAARAHLPLRRVAPACRTSPTPCGRRTSRATCPLRARHRSNRSAHRAHRGIADSTGLLVDEQDVPPLGLAFQAIEMSAPEAPLDAALRACCAR